MKEEDIENCPSDYKEVHGCSLYFYYLYNIYPSIIENVKVEYLNRIKNFPDPTLKYVALYFYDVYSVARKFFTKNSNNQIFACNILNRWLDQHRSFFTHSENCVENKLRWEKHIEPLWELLKNHFDGNTCIRSNVFSKSTQIPQGLSPFICSDLYPEDFICYNPSEEDLNKINEDCGRHKDLCEICDEYYKNSTSFAHTQSELQRYSTHDRFQVDSQTSCPTCPSLIDTFGFPVCATFLGTLFFAFFLYKFTSLGSILSNRGRNKKKFQQELSEEMAYKEFERSRNNSQRSKNRISHLHYQSMED